jgi:adenosine deaminase CECR1
MRSFLKSIVSLASFSRRCAPFLGVILAGFLSVRAEGFATRFEELKRSLPKSELYRLLYAMPKGGDLHHHAGGCWRMEDLYSVATNRSIVGTNRFFTRIRAGGCAGDTNDWTRFATISAFQWSAMDECRRSEFAALDSLSPAQAREWMDSLRLDAPGEGRDEFFERIWPRLGAVGRDANIAAEMMVRTLQRYGAEGVRYIEAQTIPDLYVAADGSMLDPEEGQRILLRRLAQADARASGVTLRLQFVVLRFTPNAVQRVEQAYDWVSRHRDTWVGINMAGREDNDKGHPRRFLEVYRKMRRQHSGIGLSIHAGEVDEPNAHMRDTLMLGATRLGHGNNVLTDDDLVLHLRHGVAFVEINLVSNLLLEYVGNYSQHHFPEMLRLGVPCGLSTDDSGMWDSGMTDEYLTAVSEFNLTWDELVRCGRNSLQWSFLEEPAKARLLAEYDRDIRAFEQRFGGDDVPSKLQAVKPVAYGFARRRWGIAY